MLKIGICDDDYSFCAQIEELLYEYAKRECLIIEIDVFYTGEDYLKYLEREPSLDILFLDIELGKVNGILIGRMIRSALENESTQIVYVSSKESYALQLFKNRPLDFLVKPITCKDIFSVMDEYRRIFGYQKSFFEYTVGKSIHRIADSEIIYFMCSGKKVLIITKDKEVREFYGKMSDVEKLLDSSRFCVVHKSYIVNLNHVLEFRSDEVLLLNGTIIPISQSMRKVVRKKVMEMSICRRIK